jgi:SET domain-containing protein
MGGGLALILNPMKSPSDKGALAITTRDSRIHGRGVFAARDIQAGEVIIDWNECSQILTEEEVEKLPLDERRCVSFIEGRYTLFKPPACWVNHSCAANTRGANGHDVAVRDIQQGEEITVDYVLENVPSLSLHCNCGSPNCRGFLGIRRTSLPDLTAI